jgi:hypothetical protein
LFRFIDCRGRGEVWQWAGEAPMTPKANTWWDKAKQWLISVFFAEDEKEYEVTK